MPLPTEIDAIQKLFELLGPAAIPLAAWWWERKQNLLSQKQMLEFVTGHTQAMMRLEAAIERRLTSTGRLPPNE